MTPSTDGRRTALALAGGGTKGAFAAGAVQYLVEEAGVVPDIVTGASAGAVVGAVLAQARGHAEAVERVAQLRRDLLAMTAAGVVFGRQPWLAALDGTPLGRLVDQVLVDRMRPPVPFEGGGTAPKEANRLGPRALASAVVKSAHRLPRARAAWRGHHQSLLTLEPLAAALRHGAGGIEPLDPQALGRPGLELRLGVTALGAGILRYVTGQGTVVASDATTPVSRIGPVSVVDAVVASSSVPGVFPPHPLAGDLYVDGGALQNVPVAPALALGAERVLAIVSVPLRRPPPPAPLDQLSFVGVFLRTSVDLNFAHRQHQDLAVARPEGTSVEVIDPLIDVVGPFEVSPGLMGIDMDYGWLRAADVTAGLDGEARRVADETTATLTIARTRAWHREEAQRLGLKGPVALAEGPRLAASIAGALERRRAFGLPLPRGAESWLEAGATGSPGAGALERGEADLASRS